MSKLLDSDRVAGRLVMEKFNVSVFHQAFRDIRSALRAYVEPLQFYKVQRTRVGPSPVERRCANAFPYKIIQYEAGDNYDKNVTRGRAYLYIEGFGQNLWNKYRAAVYFQSKRTFWPGLVRES